MYAHGDEKSKSTTSERNALLELEKMLVTLGHQGELLALAEHPKLVAEPLARRCTRIPAVGTFSSELVSQQDALEASPEARAVHQRRVVGLDDRANDTRENEQRNGKRYEYYDPDHSEELSMKMTAFESSSKPSSTAAHDAVENSRR